jgi:exodeoxyribonuclease-3
VWVTPDLVGNLKRQIVLKDARDWPQGSDHVPVCVEMRM